MFSIQPQIPCMRMRSRVGECNELDWLGAVGAAEIPCKLHYSAMASAGNSLHHIFLLPTPQNRLVLSRALDHQSVGLAKRHPEIMEDDADDMLL